MGQISKKKPGPKPTGQTRHRSMRINDEIWELLRDASPNGCITEYVLSIMVPHARRRLQRGPDRKSGT